MKGHVQEEYHVAHTRMGRHRQRVGYSRTPTAGTSRLDTTQSSSGGGRGKEAGGETTESGLAGADEAGTPPKSRKGGTHYTLEETASGGAHEEDANVPDTRLPTVWSDRRS